MDSEQLVKKMRRQSTLQMRPPGGGPWYSPTRDFVYRMPGVISRAFHSWTPQECGNDVTYEEATAYAGIVRKFCNQLAEQQPEDHIVAAVFRPQNPRLFDIFGRLIARQLLAEYQVWAAQARRKVYTDQGLDMADVEEATEDFLKKHG